MRDAVIIGGGLAGLTSAILLRRHGLNVSLIERKKYPFHRVCGEYISNEVRDFMDRNTLLPDIEIPTISRFGLSSVHGDTSYTALPLGGFGVSRYTLDYYLYSTAKKEGVELISDTVQNVVFSGDQFEISGANQQLTSKICIGAFGKRSNIDSSLNRKFFHRRSPYVGVKYHATTDHPSDLVALHNFSKGYCGISRIEDGKTNICYLTHRSNIRKHGNVPEMEQAILYRNPVLKEIFQNADFLWDKPQVINEISFEGKSTIDNHILMCGDAAGMITPLCGNGMAMAIHSAKLVSEATIEYFDTHKDRKTLERSYESSWNDNFRFRLWYGRNVQKLFGNPRLSNLSVGIINSSQRLSSMIIKNTHGKPI